MAKLTSPIKIKGTLGGLTFFNLSNDEETIIREKGKTGVKTSRFMTDPVFTNARNHGKEWGEASRFARILCRLGKQFFDHAKEGSFAGRANKLMFDVMQYDTINARGSRSVVSGLQTQNGKEELIGFEGNRNRPLPQVLITKYKLINDQLTIVFHDTSQELNWPENATHAHFAMATAIWNPAMGHRFIMLSNEEVVTPSQKTVITLHPIQQETNQQQMTADPADSLKIHFLFIGFAILTNKNYKLLHRKYNTATIITCDGITEKSVGLPLPEVNFFFSTPPNSL